MHKRRCDDGLLWPTTLKTDLRNSRVYFIVYKTICYFVFRAVGPLTALVFLNIRLIRALRDVRRRRARMFGGPASTGRGGVSTTTTTAAAATKHHENLTVMLVAVVTVFIVCQLPTLVIRVVFTVYEFAPGLASTMDLTAFRYPNIAANALLTMNSAVNFLVYCLVGKKFRRILTAEICPAGVDRYCCCPKLGTGAAANDKRSGVTKSQMTSVSAAASTALVNRRMPVAGKIGDETAKEQLLNGRSSLLVSNL